MSGSAGSQSTAEDYVRAIMGAQKPCSAAPPLARCRVTRVQGDARGAMFEGHNRGFLRAHNGAGSSATHVILSPFEILAALGAPQLPQSPLPSRPIPSASSFSHLHLPSILPVLFLLRPPASSSSLSRPASFSLSHPPPPSSLYLPLRPPFISSPSSGISLPQSPFPSCPAPPASSFSHLHLPPILPVLFLLLRPPASSSSLSRPASFSLSHPPPPSSRNFFLSLLPLLPQLPPPSSIFLPVPPPHPPFPPPSSFRPFRVSLTGPSPRPPPFPPPPSSVLSLPISSSYLSRPTSRVLLL
ncbi:hypothetical protein B0H11DRAFT_2221571 [Mycena galericulata]|nr:hypothetical protein B0H11DRAFT_2221571 [Mycena galericulata]